MKMILPLMVSNRLQITVSFLQTALCLLIIFNFSFFMLAYSAVPVNITIPNGFHLVLSQNSILSVTGNLTVNGNFFASNTSTVKFCGTSIQQIGSTGVSSFQNVEINNNANIDLSNNVTINGTLTFTQGLINTNANTLIIENANTTSITNYSTTKYVNGILRRKVASTGSYDFPVGTSVNYELANVNLITSTVGYLTVFFTIDGTGIDISGLGISCNGTILSDRLDYGWWSITPTSGSASNYDVTLTSIGHTNGGASSTQHCVVKANGGTVWTSVGTHNNSTQSGTGTAPITAKRTVLNNFSNFAIARSQTITLPVELVSFTADCNGNMANLYWQTASETNNDYYTIERCKDKVCLISGNWETVATIKGAGNSSTISKYEFADMELPLPAAAFYYRLKQTDFNGKFSYSPSIIVDCIEKSEETVTVFPNPATSLLNCLFVSKTDKDISIVIMDNLGQTIIYKKANVLNGQNIITLDINSLSTGLYFLKCESGICMFNVNK